MFNCVVQCGSGRLSAATDSEQSVSSELAVAERAGASAATR